MSPDFNVDSKYPLNETDVDRKELKYFTVKC